MLTLCYGVHAVKHYIRRYIMDDSKRAKYLDLKSVSFAWFKSTEGFYWEEYPREAKESEYSSRIFTPFLDEVERTKPPLLIEKPSGHALPYSPLEEHPKMFLEFAEVPPTKEGIVAFANKYGNLTHGIEVVTRGGWVALGDSLETWISEIIRMGHLTQLWEWATKHNNDALKKYFSWRDGRIVYVPAPTEIEKQYETAVEFYNGLHVEVPELVLQPEKYGYFWEGATKKGDYASSALFVILLNINLSFIFENRIIPQLRRNHDKSVTPHLVPTHLLAAIWLQFFQAVAGEKNFERCSICKTWEDTTDYRSSWKKHADCANRDRVARHRLKKDLLERIDSNASFNARTADKVKEAINAATTLEALKTVENEYGLKSKAKEHTPKTTLAEKRNSDQGEKTPAKKPTAKKAAAKKTTKTAATKGRS